MANRSVWVLLSMALAGVATTGAMAQNVESAGVGPIFGDQGAAFSALQVGGLAPSSLKLSCPTCPRLYDNTSICTVDFQSYAVGGRPPNNLSVLDWFTSDGGAVTGFDLYVVNGGPGAIPNRFTMQFYSGADRNSIGTPISGAGFGSGLLARIPVHRDPVTGAPRVIRVSVDYTTRQYSIVDAETEEPLIDPPIEDIGNTRLPFTLPGGKLGINVRFSDEFSVCNAGEPVCGVALAGGGSGNENGVHVLGADDPDCSNGLDLICDNFNWAPVDNLGNRVPCEGGDVCSLNRPFFGTALVLYNGPGVNNNSKDTATTIVLDSPGASCQGQPTVVTGFIGDSPLSFSTQTVEFHDCDGDGDRDLRDFACFQRCFSSFSDPICDFFDRSFFGESNGQIDLDDFGGFFQCFLDPNLPTCSGEVAAPPELLRDIDMFRVSGLSPGQVLSVLVEGGKSPDFGPVWDPYLKIFQMNPVTGVLETLTFDNGGFSDDYERNSFDAFATAKVPAGVNTLWVGISAAENKNYPTNDPPNIPPVGATQAGGYKMTLFATNPNCVQDDQSGTDFDCYQSKHEPDDTLAEADAFGSICSGNFGCTFPVAMIGDGAFSGTGQDLDIWKIELTGSQGNTRGILIEAEDEFPFGFPTTFDLALGLYDASGTLIATGDQQRRFGSGVDDSRPALSAKVLGRDLDPNGNAGVYYLAVLGTDRGLTDDECNFIFPALPPSLINFPHGPNVAATNESDIRPLVGGRVNKPGGPLEGCSTVGPPGTLQCYSLAIFTDSVPPPIEGGNDPCEALDDDSVLSACPIATFDRLSELQPAEFILGNGRRGGFQGDADFYRINANPTDIVVANVANLQPPMPNDDLETVRSYLSLFDVNGFPWADHDYSHEHADGAAFDGLSDEIAAVVAGEMPTGIGSQAFLFVGIDAGNMLQRENIPFDALFEGTTLSRRFLTNLIDPQRYRVGVAVMPKMTALPPGDRMFVVPRRGTDDLHTSCETNSPQDKTVTCFPPILELDPITGITTRVIDGDPFFFPTQPGVALPPGQVRSTKMLIAYDGQFLWVAVERCQDQQLCQGQFRDLLRVNPDLPNGDTGYIVRIAQIDNHPPANFMSGMTELNGFLYGLDETANTLRYWDKTMDPTIGNGGIMTPTPTDVGDDPRWNNLFGDIGSFQSQLYIPCNWIDPSTQAVSDIGICVFSPDPVAGTITFTGKTNDPITNDAFVPGPLLGGIDLLSDGTLVVSDQNTPILEYVTGFSISDQTVLGTVKANELPRREYLVKRLTVR